VLTLIAAIASLALLVEIVATVVNAILVAPNNRQCWSRADINASGSVDFVVDSTALAGVGAHQLPVLDFFIQAHKMPVVHNNPNFFAALRAGSAVPHQPQKNKGETQ
jgi:hypothetical protein